MMRPFLPPCRLCLRNIFSVASSSGIVHKRLTPKGGKAGAAAVFLVGGAAGLACKEAYGRKQAVAVEESADVGLVSLKKRTDVSGNTCWTREQSGAAKVLDLSAPEFREVRITSLDPGDASKNYSAVAHVGCQVTMEELTEACLRQNLVPQVTPEFRQITVGGAVVGGGVESSSGRFGEFAETCRAVVVRLGDGRVLRCENASDLPNAKNAELFDALSGSYGTLCSVLSAEVKLMPAKPHILLSYRWYSSEEALASVSKALVALSQSHDFAEALCFPEGAHCVITADFVAAGEGGSVSHINNPDQPWFYERVRQSKSGKDAHDGSCSYQELAATQDYLHRHERGAFWMARPEGDDLSASDLLLQGRIFGALFDLFSREQGLLWTRPREWMFFHERWKTGYLFKVLRQLPQAIVADEFLVTDIYTDVEKTPSLVAEAWGQSLMESEVAQAGFRIATPIWLCPMRAPDRRQLLSAHGHRGAEKDQGHGAAGGNRILIDVGLWGRVLCAGPGPRVMLGSDAAKWLEQWGLRHGARKMLYSQNFYDREEDFWTYADGAHDAQPEARFRREIYDRLRRIYGAEGRLPSLYEKVGNCERRVGESRQGLRYHLWQLLCALT